MRHGETTSSSSSDALRFSSRSISPSLPHRNPTAISSPINSTFSATMSAVSTRIPSVSPPV